MTPHRPGTAVAGVVFVLLALVAPPPARAGDTPTLGASLGATPDTVVIDSTASVRQLVTLTAPDGWALAETTFAMDPGERRRVAIVETGPDKGQIVATFEAVGLPVGMDTSSLVLALGVAPPAMDWRPFLLIPFIVSLVVLAAGVRRYRHAS